MRIIDALLSSPAGPHHSESANRRGSASAQPTAPHAPRSAVIKRDSMKATRIVTIFTSNEPVMDTVLTTEDIVCYVTEAKKKRIEESIRSSMVRNTI